MTDRTKLAFLNVVRIVLAVSIVLLHCLGCQFGFVISEHRFLNLFRYLSVCGGIQVFFLISGMMFYLAYYKKLTDDTRQGEIKYFLKGRVIRFLPLVTIATLFTFFITVLSCFIFKDTSFSFNQLCIDLFFLGNTLFNGGLANYNPEIWYLSILVFCYLVSVFIIVVTKKKKSIWWFLMPLFFGFYIVNSKLGLSYYRVGVGLYNYFLGFYIMIFLQKFENFKKPTQITLRIIGALIAMSIFLLFVLQHYSCEYFGPCEIAFNLIIWIPLFTCLYGLKLNKIFNNKFFNFLGSLSFHIYVLQHPVDVFYSFIIKCFKFNLHPTLGFVVYYIALFVISIVSVILISKLTKVLKRKFLQRSEMVKPKENI